MSDRTNQLCELAKAGNLSAASELVTGHYQKIFAYLRRRCGNDEDAADLTQKTFAKVWAALPNYERRSSFSTWLHGISYNVYVDWRRKGNRLHPQTDEWWEACAADEPSPFENAVERDLAGRLYAMVEQLEENAREVVHLHYYQGLSLKETSEVLNIATSTVKYRLREALNVLRSFETIQKEKSNL